MNRNSPGPPPNPNYPSVSLRTLLLLSGRYARLMAGGPFMRPALERMNGGAKFLSVFLISASALHAQGILTVTPSRSAATIAGTGTVGYTGDGSAAISATLAKPSAVAYDGSGNLYLADENNHVIREVSTNGTITTVAGTGIEGYSGDGAAATAAQLDTPTGIAVDKSGNLYIADSHNQRIRMVSSGTITTIAGTGIKGYAGDGATATAASLALPSGVAVDSSGNLYIADTDNHRIRKITSGTITTIAGDGEELYAGDGGAATAAALDSPTGVAVDTSGNVYIADRLNQRIREVSGGTINTIAGSGAASFSGGFAGDGASPIAATLAKPTGVSVDGSGNIYIADTNNQVVRQIGGGAIASIAGSPTIQGFGGDNGPATAAVLNSPKAVAIDAVGDLSIADTRNQRVRSGALPSIAFANAAVGIDSPIQSVTLANTGSAPISVSSIAFAGAFTVVTGGTCPAAPITLAVGATCTQDIAFLPVATGAVSGNVVFSGAGVVPQTILLSGTGTQEATGVSLVSSVANPFVTQSVTFTATVTPTAGTGVPPGTVTFYSNGISIGTGTLANGIATLTTSFTPGGIYAITAVYTATANFAGSTSATLNQQVVDFTIPITPVAGSSFDISVQPGGKGIFNFTLAPLNGPFTIPITFSVTGLPPGATATFSPTTVTLGPSPANFTMTVQTAKTTGALRRLEIFAPIGGTTFALLLLPFTRKLRRRGRRMRSLLMLTACLLSLGAVAGITGCGSGSGFFGQQQQAYNINVIATATSGGVTLQRSITVQLTVQ